MMRWPRSLTYGNWGGPGWSGGDFVHDPAMVNYSAGSVDSMDDLFFIHDGAYQATKGSSYSRCMRRYADAELLAGLIYLPLLTRHWPRKPKRWYHAQAYRFAAIIGFGIKLITGF
jgi:hypothetical protein